MFVSLEVAGRNRMNLETLEGEPRLESDHRLGEVGEATWSRSVGAAEMVELAEYDCVASVSSRLAVLGELGASSKERKEVPRLPCGTDRDVACAMVRRESVKDVDWLD